MYFTPRKMAIIRKKTKQNKQKKTTITKKTTHKKTPAFTVCPEAIDGILPFSFFKVPKAV